MLKKEDEKCKSGESFDWLYAFSSGKFRVISSDGTYIKFRQQLL
jgi:hypothetical protein